MVLFFGGLAFNIWALHQKLDNDQDDDDDPLAMMLTDGYESESLYENSLYSL